jgi:hypothetical protein
MAQSRSSPTPGEPKSDSSAEESDFTTEATIRGLSELEATRIIQTDQPAPDSSAEESTTDGLPPAREPQPIDVVKLQAERKFGNPDELSEGVVVAFRQGHLKLADSIESYTQGLELAARRFEAVGGTMEAWTADIYGVRNLVKTPQATNDFQPYVKWAHGDNRDTSGIISRLAYALHVWAEYPADKRPSPVVNEGETESAFIRWLKDHSGYYGLYRGRDESYGRYIDIGDYTVYKLKVNATKPDDIRWRVYLTGGEDLGDFEEHFPEAMAEVKRQTAFDHAPTIDHPATFLTEGGTTALIKVFTDAGCHLVETEMAPSVEPVTPERIRAQAAQSSVFTTTAPTAPSSPPRRTAAAPTGRGRGRPAGQRSRGGGSTTPKGKHSRVVNAVDLLGQTKDLAQIIIGDASKHALEQAEKAMLFFREVADEIEIELNKIDEKVARAEARKGGRRKAA